MLLCGLMGRERSNTQKQNKQLRQKISFSFLFLLSCLTQLEHELILAMFSREHSSNVVMSSRGISRDLYPELSCLPFFVT